MLNLKKRVYKNLANTVSILGVIPLCLLFQQDGYQYLIPLMLYCNVMDDLDGILAGQLDIRSDFGARLDNVCDAIAHCVFVMVVGMHYGGVVVIALALLSAMAIVVRSVARLDPDRTPAVGSPTNELIRHVFFVIVLASIFDFNPHGCLMVVFLLNSVSMLMPYKMPYLTRSITKSAFAIAGLNVALIVAWLVPSTTAVIAACFAIPYLCSFVAAINKGMRPVAIAAN